VCVTLLGATPGQRTIGLQRTKADPGGAGGIPYTGGPQQWGDWHSQKLTEGLVIDMGGQPLAGLLVVVTDSQSDIVAAVLTDGDGAFCISLPVEPGLELALPGEGIAGISVEAGAPILVVVR
jgi:hypothetical protein